MRETVRQLERQSAILRMYFRHELVAPTIKRAGLLYTIHRATLGKESFLEGEPEQTVVLVAYTPRGPTNA